MNVTDFFNNVLHAKLANPVQSWGAVDLSGRIFLRIWKDQITPDGKKVRVGFIENKPPTRKHSMGVPERNRHIESIKKGTEAFGVICIAKNPHADPSIRRRIDDFSKRLAKLGVISEENGIIYADIVGYIATDDVLNRKGD